MITEVEKKLEHAATVDNTEDMFLKPCVICGEIKEADGETYYNKRPICEGCNRKQKVFFNN